MAAVVLGLGLLADSTALHLGAGAALVAFGIFRFVRPHAHFRLTTMRVNRRELTWWSFVMSSAHGAGFLIAPVLLGKAWLDLDWLWAGAFVVAGLLTLFT